MELTREIFLKHDEIITSQHYCNKLTRNQVIDLLGEEIVLRLDELNCDVSGVFSTDCDADYWQYSAKIYVGDYEGQEVFLTAFYYQKKLEEDCIELDCLEWNADHYTLGI